VQSPSNAYVVTVIPDTPAEAINTTVTDLLMGVISMTAVMLMVALVLGVMLAGVRVALRRLFPPAADHMPGIKPYDSESPLPPSAPPL
jgi:hypothetical protein